MPELPHPPMKNIQIIDGAENSVYDIFQATEDEFAVIFPTRKDEEAINPNGSRLR
jgi:hypothetical protein